MLKAVAFRQDFRTFQKGDWVYFPGAITLVVADQGAGKSTLIELIRALATPPNKQKNAWQSVTISQEEARRIAIPFADGPEFRIWARDFERDSVRNRPDIVPEEQGGLSLQLASMRVSHGQSNRLVLDQVGSQVLSAPTLFLLDEPDNALSPRSCYELVRILRKLRSDGHQVIASVHNPIVIRGQIPEDSTSGWETVYDLETRQELTPDAYLEIQAQPKPAAHPTSSGT